MADADPVGGDNAKIVGVECQANGVNAFHVVDGRGNRHIVEAGWYLSCHGPLQGKRKTGCPSGYRPPPTKPEHYWSKGSQPCVAMLKVCERLLGNVELTQDVISKFCDQETECGVCLEVLPLNIRANGFLVCCECYKPLHTACAQKWCRHNGTPKCPFCQSSADQAGVVPHVEDRGHPRPASKIAERGHKRRIDGEVLNLSEFVEHVGGPVNAARAIEASWVDAKLIPGPPTPTSEIPLTVFLSGDREEGFRVCPTYQIPHLGALPADLSMEGLPFVSEDVTLKLMSDDVLYPADLFDLVENNEDELDVGVEEHMEAVQEVSSGLTERHVGALFAEHQQLLLVFVSADSKGVYIGLVATRIDVVPAGAEAYPKEVNGVRVLLFGGGIDLLRVYPDATMSPALAGATIGPDPKKRYGTLGAVVRDLASRWLSRRHTCSSIHLLRQKLSWRAVSCQRKLMTAPSSLGEVTLLGVRAKLNQPSILLASTTLSRMCGTQE
eukprot:m.235663 g.235663  ORF g.235663 m.235663 type:complete len:496 (-) comp15762_c2_seq1:1848-3335(-)